MLDTTKTKYIVIQYTENDIRENKAFYLSGEHTTAPIEKWEKAVNYYNKERRYYPGKYSVRVIIQMLSGLKGKFGNEDGAKQGVEQDEAKYFLNALLRSGEDLSSIKILVFDVGQYSTDVDFLRKLEKEMQRDIYPEWLKNNIVTVDISGSLDDTMYYYLDGHINDAGHLALAHALARYIE